MGSEIDDDSLRNDQTEHIMDMILFIIQPLTIKIINWYCKYILMVISTVINFKHMRLR